NYADYYEYVADVDGQHMLIGLTYNLSQIMKDINKETTVGTSFATGWQLALMLVTLAMTLAFVVSPLKRIQSAIREYRTTKESSLVVGKLQSMSRNNEIGELSEDVVDLAQSIDRYIARIEKITEEKSRIDSELNLAKSIQASMLPQEFPPFPDRNEVDIYALMEPAKMVGGDFYDFFFIDDDHLALLIADVSGKGIPAALFMMICIIILKNSLRFSKSISKALANTNEAICSNNTNEMFVTVWMGILEISTGKLTAANAGHEYPAIRRKDGSYELMKDKHGFVVGGMRHIKYEEYEIQMEPGDKIYVYSDGVPEANNKNKEMFGTARLLDALNSVTDSTPKEDINNVKTAIAEFVQEEEQFDDVTMLCFEYKGKE
ncbi:MAG: serine/threonine-protein phosphatase, partial [Erysipelotrichaceae bacterium]|nr:serine/threonine-protein phosphatase [Erysipelotrichaceae bacterium]